MAEIFPESRKTKIRTTFSRPKIGLEGHKNTKKLHLHHKILCEIGRNVADVDRVREQAHETESSPQIQNTGKTRVPHQQGENNHNHHKKERRVDGVHVLVCPCCVHLQQPTCIQVERKDASMSSRDEEGQGERGEGAACCYREMRADATPALHNDNKLQIQKRASVANVKDFLLPWKCAGSRAPTTMTHRRSCPKK